MKALLQMVQNNEMLRRLMPQANRKFFFAICLLVAGTWLCANGKMTAETWRDFGLGMAFIYIGGNVGQKWVERKYGVAQPEQQIDK